MAGLWHFLSDPANRDTLAWIGGGLCVVVSGLWVAVKHFQRPPSPPAAKAGAERRAQARHGIGATGNVTAGRDVVVGDVALPRLAIGLAGLGMILLALALILDGGDATTGSVTAGGDIEDSTITIGAPPAHD